VAGLAGNKATSAPTKAGAWAGAELGNIKQQSDWQLIDNARIDA